MDISLIGDKSLMRALKNMEGPEVLKAARKGVRAGAKIVLKPMKQLAPEKTGALIKAIVLRVGKRHYPGRYGMAIMLNPFLTDWLHAASGKVAEGSKRHKSGKGKVGTDYYYPAAQEFGWTKNGVYYEGKPFMREAFDRNVSHSGIVTQEIIWKQIVRLWQQPGPN